MKQCVKYGNLEVCMPKGTCKCGQSMVVGDDLTMEYLCIDCAMALAQEQADEDTQGNDYPETEAEV